MIEMLLPFLILTGLLIVVIVNMDSVAKPVRLPNRPNLLLLLIPIFFILFWVWFACGFVTFLPPIFA